MVEPVSGDERTLTSHLAADLDGAFPALVRAHQDGIYSGILRLTGDRSDAEDLTQETFVRAYRALQGYGPARIADLQLRGWLWTIALNLSRNRARRRSRRPPTAPLDPAVPDADPDPETVAVVRHQQDAWARRLAALPAPARTAVVLRHVVGLSYDEIAAATGRPAGTAKSDAHRGLQRLRSMLEQEIT